MPFGWGPGEIKIFMMFSIFGCQSSIHRNEHQDTIASKNHIHFEDSRLDRKMRKGKMNQRIFFESQR